MKITDAKATLWAKLNQNLWVGRHWSLNKKFPVGF